MNNLPNLIIQKYFLYITLFKKIKRWNQVARDVEMLKAYYLGSMSNVAQFTEHQLDRRTITKIRIGLFGPTGI